MMKLAVCLVLVCGAVGALAQREVHPCTGRTGGFAADLNNCRQFWRCSERPPTPGRCDSDQFFNDERQECVYPQYSNCFRCDRNTAWRLSSVRRSCQQFTRCFFGRGSLHACGNGLWFDGRNDVRNCNRRPVSGSCHLSDDNASSNVEVVTCPNTQITRPLYLRVRNSCQSYHVCTRANGRAETRTCPNDLHFNLSTEQCDLPERAGCDTNVLPPGIEGPVERCAFPPTIANQRIADRSSCAAFWLCPREGTVPQAMTCANGLIFDYQIRDCNTRSNGARCWFEDNRNLRSSEDNISVISGDETTPGRQVRNKSIDLL